MLLGRENLEHGYIDSPLTALKVIEAISSSYLHLYMDMGNLAVNERDVLREIEAARVWVEDKLRAGYAATGQERKRHD